MAAEKKVNYSEEMTQEIIKRYQDGESVESIAESMNRAVRSVRSKLVREGVYIAPEKAPKSKREEGPTKKEMLNTLESMVPFPVEGFMGATKEAIGFLIAHFRAEDDSPAEDDFSGETEQTQAA